MPFNTLPKLLVQMLTMCCAASFAWSTATAQTDTLSDEVGFAGAEICKPGLIDIPVELKTEQGGNQDDKPTSIEADSIEAEGNSKIVLTGNAQVVQGNRGVYADRIVYDQDTYQAEAEGNVIFYTPNGDEIKADTLDMEVDTFIGEAQGVKVKVADQDPFTDDREHLNFVEDYSVFAPFRSAIIIDTDEGFIDDNTYIRARATADSMAFEGNDFERLKNATFTTCAEGNKDVLLSAKEIELDHASGIGTAKSMTVRFKNVPIFYFPSASFPINNQRKTGFLFPSVGYETESGGILSVPYYINIAPQYDATVIPRILTERGVQIFGEFRYMTENSRGEVRGEYLPSDRVFNDEDRHAFGYDHRQDIGKDWEATVDLATVSDSSYLRDFSNDVGIIASSYVSQRARLDYFGDMLRFNARVATYDSVNDSISDSSQPYETLPELVLDLRPQEFGVFEGGIDSEFINYQHNDTSQIEGSRLRIKPYIAAPLEQIYGFVEPRVSVQTINYSLDNNNPATGGDSPSVAVPIFSVDSGLFFEREFNRNDSSFIQTLEPRLFYLNIPTELEQNLFPNFDTGGGSNSSFGHYFRENRFFGGDRVGDTEQISLGLISRISDDDTGTQRLKLSLGEIFYLEDREVVLNPGDDPDTENTSDTIGEITAAITRDWDLTGFARWNNEESTLDSFRLSALYDHSSRRNARIAYTFNNDSSEQLNFDFGAPIGPRWQVKADAAYSIEDEELRSSGLSLSFDGCCWAIRLGAQHYLDGTGEYKDRYIFTFELDDLGRISSGL